MYIRGGAEAAVDGADGLVLRLILHACDGKWVEVSWKWGLEKPSVVC